MSGIYGHGPTTNTIHLLRYNPNLAPYLVYAYSEFYPDFDEAQVLLPERLANLEEAKNLCVDEAFQFNTAQGGNTYTAEFWQALQEDEVETRFPDIAQFLCSNNSDSSIPVLRPLLCKGTEIPLFPWKSSRSLCSSCVPMAFRLS